MNDSFRQHFYFDKNAYSYMNTPLFIRGTRRMKRMTNNHLDNDKAALLEEIENYRLELSEVYKMVHSLKNAYLQEQKKVNETIESETSKIRERSAKIEEENRYLRARLSAYKNSKLGKVTTWYWNLRKK